VRSILKDHYEFPSGAGRETFAPPDPEDGGIMILQNIRNCLPGDSVSHPRRLECNAVSSVDSTVIK
jgi:hypothetical protein